MKIILETSELKNLFKNKTKEHLREIKEKTREGYYKHEESFINLSEREENLRELEELKNYQDIQHLFFIGIGGSHLPIYTLKNFLEEKINKKIYFFENLDELEIRNNLKVLRNILEGKDFLVIVISKSGKTLETLINFYFVFDLIKEYWPNNWNEHFIILSDYNSSLDKFAIEKKIKRFNLPPIKSGRFLAFSLISLIFLYLCKLDFENFLRGAKWIKENFFKEDIEENLTLKNVLWIYKNVLDNKRFYNLFIFSSFLNGLGLWYRQLIAESLGKENRGLVPYYFQVNRDFHSIYQLLVQGYQEHFSSFIYLNNPSNLIIKDNFIFDLNLTRKKLNDINLAIYESVKENFKDLNFSFYEIILEEKSEFEIGAFMQHKMLEIVLLGKILNINPFDQPGVEGYKSKIKKFFDLN